MDSHFLSMERMILDPCLGRETSKPPDLGLDILHTLVGMQKHGLEQSLHFLGVADPEDYNEPSRDVKDRVSAGPPRPQSGPEWSPEWCDDQFELFCEEFAADLPDQHDGEATSVPETFATKRKPPATGVAGLSPFGTNRGTSEPAQAAESRDADNGHAADWEDPNLRGQIVSGLPSTWPMWTRTVGPVLRKVPDPFSLRAKELGVFKKTTSDGLGWAHLDFTPMSSGMKNASPSLEMRRSKKSLRNGKRRRKKCRSSMHQQFAGDSHPATHLLQAEEGLMAPSR